MHSVSIINILQKNKTDICNVPVSFCKKLQLTGNEMSVEWNQSMWKGNTGNTGVKKSLESTKVR